MRRISILGSTGSIGTQALDLVAGLPDELRIVALAAGRNVGRLAEQARRFRPKLAVVSDPELGAELADALRDLPEIRTACGPEALEEAAAHPDADVVLAAIVGAAGVVPTHRALVEGKDVALANKEALVVAGEVLTATADRTGASILPVDSEHAALHQCLRAGRPGEVARLILTASGGAFRETPAEELARVTPERALRHPRWSMGAKITIDSGTLMNKGLEVIEGRWLFGIPPERIEVVVHPESLVHSLVEFVDGVLIAQISATDMRLPIAYALTYPERLPIPGPRLDVAALGALHFEPPDTERFPCLRLAYRALEAGGGAPAVLNAANEVAVGAFLEERIPFTGIPGVVSGVLDSLDGARPAGLEGLLELDARARVAAEAIIRDGKL